MAAAAGEKGADQKKSTAFTKADVATQTEVVTSSASAAQSGVVPSVRIIGATGINAGVINGVYEPTGELSDGNMTVYRKMGAGDVWLEYHASTKLWQVKRTAAKGTSVCLAYCVVTVKGLPTECPKGQWQIDDGSKFYPQPAITVSITSEDEAEAYRAELEREAARVVKGISSVRVEGATGTHADKINGVYQPTDELSEGNVTVYRKVGAGDVWLEYGASAKLWQVKPTDAKGTYACWARCVVPTKGLPTECSKGQWQVAEGTKFHPQPAVIVSTTSEDEAEAYRAELEREAARVVKGISSVRVEGATGTHADKINGVYQPTDELSEGNVTVYRKVGAGDVWLEYHASSKLWRVKPTAAKGTNTCWAHCVVPAKCLPTDCPKGQWQVGEGTMFHPQPAITVSAASEDDVEAYRAELEREAARVEKGISSVRVEGATGTHADKINGVYQPTDELSEGNVTVYRKVGAGDVWLEYYASSKLWQVKRTAAKGTDACWVYCVVTVKGLPTECPKGQWQVGDGTMFHPQPAITVSVATEDEVKA